MGQQEEYNDAKLTLIEALTGREITLCEYRTEELWVTVWARLKNGELTVEGQDLGDAPKKWFGDDEYEYFYFFDQANTDKLLKLLGQDQKDPFECMKQHFSGLTACRDLRSFCEENGIEYRFDCYY